MHHEIKFVYIIELLTLLEFHVDRLLHIYVFMSTSVHGAFFYITDKRKKKSLLNQNKDLQ